MQTQFPETLNFLRQVERNYRYEGEVALSQLERFTDVLLGREGSVQVALEFGSCVGYPCLKGVVSASVEVECQRCLQPMLVEVSSRFKLGLVHTEEECDLLPEVFEPYLLEGEEQSLLALLEDELLLSLPMVTVHGEACSDFMRQQVEEIQAEKAAAHPFAALKSLKKET
ncbi:MAG TPA: hypothetical protein ENJ64_04940 [Thiotrichales bacterium]|nr:hypothetical protein [Thiotrichales bacterium]